MLLLIYCIIIPINYIDQQKLGFKFLNTVQQLKVSLGFILQIHKVWLFPVLLTQPGSAKCTKEKSVFSVQIYAIIVL